MPLLPFLQLQFRVKAPRQRDLRPMLKTAPEGAAEITEHPKPKEMSE
jgi:hypothetical protein